MTETGVRRKKDRSGTRLGADHLLRLSVASGGWSLGRFGNSTTYVAEH